MRRRYFFVAGCAGRVANVNSLSYQGGQAITNEEILLTNIIAAAHDRAATFIAPKGTTTLAFGQADLSANLNTVTPNDVFSPKISGKRQQTVTIVDYGATEAAKILYNDVPIRLSGELVVSGWPGSLAATLLFKRLGIYEELWSLIERTAAERCDSNDDPRCVWIRKNQMCEPEPSYGELHLYYFNTAQERCDFIGFQMIMFALDITGTSFGVRKFKDDKGATQEQVEANFADDAIRGRFDELRNDPRNKDIPIFQWSLRSPEEIIQFLGRLTALQLYSKPPFVAEVRTRRGPVVLFRVYEGTGSGAAISVRSEFGAYHVPQTNPLSSRDYSLRVMAFLIKLQNWAQQKAPIQGNTIGILQ